MAGDGKREARTYKIPPIEIYEVTGDQLDLIEESSRSVGQDFTFAISSLSIFIAFVVALSSANPSNIVRTIYFVIAAVSFAVCLYTGIKWMRARRKTPNVIEKIRSRKMDPQSSNEP